MSNQIDKIPKRKWDKRLLNALSLSLTLHAAGGVLVKCNSEEHPTQNIKAIQMNTIGLVNINIPNTPPKPTPVSIENTTNLQAPNQAISIKKPETQTDQAETFNNPQEEPETIISEEISETETETETEQESSQDSNPEELTNKPLTPEQLKIIAETEKTGKLFEPFQKELLEKYSEYIEMEKLPKEVLRSFIPEYLTYLDAANIAAKQDSPSVNSEHLDIAKKRVQTYMDFIDYNLSNIDTNQSETKIFQQISDVIKSIPYKLSQSNPLEFATGINCDGINITALVLINETTNSDYTIGSEGLVVNGVGHVRAFIRSNQDPSKTFIIDTNFTTENSSDVTGPQGGELISYMLGTLEGESKLSAATQTVTNSLRRLPTTKQIGENKVRDLSHLEDNPGSEINQEDQLRYEMLQSGRVSLSIDSSNNSQRNTSNQGAENQGPADNADLENNTQNPKYSLEELIQIATFAISDPSQITLEQVFSLNRFRSEFSNSNIMFLLNITKKIFTVDQHTFSDNKIKIEFQKLYLKMLVENQFTSNNQINEKIEELTYKTAERYIQKYSSFYNHKTREIDFSASTPEKITELMELIATHQDVFSAHRFHNESMIFNHEGRVNILTNTPAENRLLLDEIQANSTHQQIFERYSTLKPKTLNGLESAKHAQIDLSQTLILENQAGTYINLSNKIVATPQSNPSLLKSFIEAGYEIVINPTQKSKEEIEQRYIDFKYDLDFINHMIETNPDITMHVNFLNKFKGGIKPSQNIRLKKTIWVAEQILNISEFVERSIQYSYQKGKFIQLKKMTLEFKFQLTEKTIKLIQEFAQKLDSLIIEVQDEFSNEYLDSPEIQKLISEKKLIVRSY